MRVQLLRFAGYPAGQTDFETVGMVQRDSPVLELDDVCKTIAAGICGTENVRGAITIVGHSDRQDRADMSCDQRRDSEIAAARDRAISAWEVMKTIVARHAAEDGWNGGDWWEESDRVTWALVYAAAGMLRNASANETERAQNRRVEFLVSVFHA